MKDLFLAFLLTCSLSQAALPEEGQESFDQKEDSSSQKKLRTGLKLPSPQQLQKDLEKKQPSHLIKPKEKEITCRDLLFNTLPASPDAAINLVLAAIYPFCISEFAIQEMINKESDDKKLMQSKKEKLFYQKIVKSMLVGLESLYWAFSKDDLRNKLNAQQSETRPEAWGG